MNKFFSILIDKVGLCHRTLMGILDILQAHLQSDSSRLLRSEDQEKELPRLLSAKEVKAIFDITHSTYYRWIDNGKLCPIQIEKRHYHRQDVILEILKKRNFRKRGGL